MGLLSRKLSVEELFRLKWLIGALMAAVSVLSLFDLGGHNLIPASITLAGISIGILFPHLYSRAPQAVWKVFTISIVPLVSIDVLAKETVPALLNLSTWLILYRAINHTKRREEMQLALLCLFLLVMTGMLTTSLVFGWLLLLFSGLAVAFLAMGSVFETKSDGKSEIESNADIWEEHEGWGSLLQSAGFRSVAMGSALFAALLVIAGIAFLFIPRVNVDEKMDLFNRKASSTLSGFSESISLGEVTDIKNDERVALRVDVEGEIFVPEIPYWRILVLDSYRMGSFSLSQQLKNMLNTGVSSPYVARRYWKNRTFSETPSSKRSDRWTFFVEPGVSKFLPLMGSFSQFTYSNLEDLHVGLQMHVVSLPETPSKMVSYQLEGVEFTTSVPDVTADHFLDMISKPGEDTLGKVSFPDTLLQLPDESAARSYLKSVVEEITGGATLDAMEFASKATEYLSQTHSYSMSFSLSPDSNVMDPVIRWMQSDLSGHCEFFASSLILLSRAAGHPARAVIGYKGGAWNSFENYYMIKNSDAHAWCEVYDGEGSWFRVDPTPGSGLPSSIERTVSLDFKSGESNSKAYIDSLRMLWYRRIVNFDETAQKEAAAQLKDFFLAYAEVAEDWATRAMLEIYSWIIAPWSVKKFFYSTTLLILAVGVLLFQRNLALNYRELIMAPFRRGDPIRRKASKLLRRFYGSSGSTNTEGEARREAVLLELHRLRFGRKDTWPNPRIVFKNARRYL
ncbi:MAG: hypothetical protein CBD18_06800 [Opitutales bacterium TMED158]|nr:MAG: hypothetical protein CBD18_06800 [Opitutales bacterium TMED158]